MWAGLESGKCGFLIGCVVKRFIILLLISHPKGFLPKLLSFGFMVAQLRRVNITVSRICHNCMEVMVPERHQIKLFLQSGRSSGTANANIFVVIFLQSVCNVFATGAEGVYT